MLLFCTESTRSNSRDLMRNDEGCDGTFRTVRYNHCCRENIIVFFISMWRLPRQSSWFSIRTAAAPLFSVATCQRAHKTDWLLFQYDMLYLTNRDLNSQNCEWNVSCTSYSRTFTIHKWLRQTAYILTHNLNNLEHIANNGTDTIKHTDVYNAQF